MQTAENKRPDSFLIAEFRDSFKDESHFRTPRSHASALRGQVAPDVSVQLLPSPASHSSLATRHWLLNSNRQTPGLLEINVNCRKQTVGDVSNRQCFTFFRTHSARPGIRVPVAAPQHLPADHCPLTPDHCRSLIPPSRSLP